MSKTKPTKQRKKPLYASRVEFFDASLLKRLEAKRLSLRPVPGWKPFLEMLIERGLAETPVSN